MTGMPSCTSGAKNKKQRKTKDNTLLKLLQVINEAKLTPIQIGKIIPEFLFSIGASLDDNKLLSTPEEILIEYAKNPTLGSALMAQALWMRDNWEKAIQGKGLKK